jgi:hypothetical protein
MLEGQSKVCVQDQACETGEGCSDKGLVPHFIVTAKVDLRSCTCVLCWRYLGYSSVGATQKAAVDNVCSAEIAMREGVLSICMGIAACHCTARINTNSSSS